MNVCSDLNESLNLDLMVHKPDTILCIIMPLLNSNLILAEEHLKVYSRELSKMWILEGLI